MLQSVVVAVWRVVYVGGRCWQKREGNTETGLLAPAFGEGVRIYYTAGHVRLHSVSGTVVAALRRRSDPSRSTAQLLHDGSLAPNRAASISLRQLPPVLCYSIDRS